MLVVSRRESDRLVFPELGISIVVVKLTRQRATLGIRAPKEVRVLREELLDKDQLSTTEVEVPESNLVELVHQLKTQIDAATQQAKSAHEELSAGNKDEALNALSQTIAELDALRIKMNESDDLESAQADPWTIAGGVAETSAGYHRSLPATRCHGRARALLLNDYENDLAMQLSGLGFDINLANGALEVLCETSGNETPDRVLLIVNEIQPDGEATAYWIGYCTPDAQVQTVFADPESMTIGAEGEPIA